MRNLNTLLPLQGLPYTFLPSPTSLPNPYKHSIVTLNRAVNLLGIVLFKRNKWFKLQMGLVTAWNCRTRSPVDRISKICKIFGTQTVVNYIEFAVLPVSNGGPRNLRSLPVG
eukprot:EG_transcript_40374